jgi:hypothetical protein
MALNVSLLRPVLVTLVALAVYRLGHYIPLPGVEHEALQDMINGSLAGNSISRVSLLALGVIPWFSAVALVEFAILVFDQKHEFALAKNGHADPFHPWVITLAIALAIYQSTGIATAFQAMQNLVVDPGPMFQWTTALTLTAGVALTMVIAKAIDSYGIGRGFWVLYASALLFRLPELVVQTHHLVASGAFASSLFFISGAVVVLGTTLILWLLMARTRAGFPAFETLVWPIVLGSTVAFWIAAFLPADVMTAPVVTLLIVAMTTLAGVISVNHEGSEKFLFSTLLLLIFIALAGQAYFIFPGTFMVSEFIGAHLVVLIALLHSLFIDDPAKSASDSVESPPDAV